MESAPELGRALRRYLLSIGYQATLIDAYLSALMLIAGLA
jgi:hypothetical protein